MGTDLGGKSYVVFGFGEGCLQSNKYMSQEEVETKKIYIKLRQLSHSLFLLNTLFCPQRMTLVRVVLTNSSLLG